MNGVPFPVGPCVMTLVLVAALWDMQTRRIPNWLVATGLIVAIPVQWFTHGGVDGMTMWLGGLLAGGADGGDRRFLRRLRRTRNRFGDLRDRWDRVARNMASASPDARRTKRGGGIGDQLRDAGKRRAAKVRQCG
jgi:hypothetical protein